MPFQMKIQPVDDDDAESQMKADQSAKPWAKSRLKRLFERQFPKLAGVGEGKEKDDVSELEPSSVPLDKLVVSFIEDSNEKPSRCGRRRCNCFNRNCDERSDDEFVGDTPPLEASEIIEGLVPCESVIERNLLADASKIVETTNKSKIGKGKENCIKIVTENLQSLGYDASICKSKWEKTPPIPAGEYEYIDVMIEGDRYILDVDFRSEFEIARSTKKYRSVLQYLPWVFVGKADRVQQIVTVVSEAARLSLKKKGLHFPPWRKLEYMKAKWLASYERKSNSGGVNGAPCAISAVNFNCEFEMRGEVDSEPMTETEAKITVVVSQWTPPAVKPKSVTKVVTGLASVLREEKLPSPTKF